MAREYESLAHKNIARSELEEVIAKVAESQGWRVGEPEAGSGKTEEVFVLKKFFKRLRIKIPLSGQPRASRLINQILYSYSGGFMNLATRNDALEYAHALTEEIDGHILSQQFYSKDSIKKIDD